jgi:hypothetical protein
MSNINVTGQQAYFNEDAKFFKDVYIYGTLYYEFESNVKEIFGDIEVNGSATFNGPAFFKRLNVSEYFSVGIGSTVISASALTGNVGINSVFPEQKLDILGSIKVDEFIYDSVNSPGENGYYLSRNEEGIIWVGAVPSSSGGSIFIQDEGDYIPIAGIAQSFTTLNFKQINSLGVGTDTIIPIPRDRKSVGRERVLR